MDKIYQTGSTNRNPDTINLLDCKKEYGGDAIALMFEPCAAGEPQHTLQEIPHETHPQIVCVKCKTWFISGDTPQKIYKLLHDLVMLQAAVETAETERGRNEEIIDWLTEELSDESGTPREDIETKWILRFHLRGETT